MGDGDVRLTSLVSQAALSVILTQLCSSTVPAHGCVGAGGSAASSGYYYCPTGSVVGWGRPWKVWLPARAQRLGKQRLPGLGFAFVSVLRSIRHYCT